MMNHSKEWLVDRINDLEDSARDMLLRIDSMQWQTIETAPVETEVLIGCYIDGEWHFGKSCMFYERGNEFEGETFSGWLWAVDDCSESIADNPTHWMPLPAPPTS